MLSQKLLSEKRYFFSGHETFKCKSLWLKKGYDFIKEGKSFNDEDSVIELGVGKNMVSSIKYWMRTFGMTKDDELTQLSDYLFNDEYGKDPFIEDLGTLWLLHYSLVATIEASIYPLFFIEFQKEKKEFTRDQLFVFIKRKCSQKNSPNLYNDNTIKKDIGVLLQNYVIPEECKPYEDFLVLLIDLNLIVTTDNKYFTINYSTKQRFIPEILLYAIIDKKEDESVITYDELLETALIFCLSQVELDEYLRILENKYTNILRFTDDSGIKQLLFLSNIDKFSVLENYYIQSNEI